MKLSFLIAVSWVFSVEVVCLVFWFCETFDSTRRETEGCRSSALL